MRTSCHRRFHGGPLISAFLRPPSSRDIDTVDVPARLMPGGRWTWPPSGFQPTRRPVPAMPSAWSFNPSGMVGHVNPLRTTQSPGRTRKSHSSSQAWRTATFRSQIARDAVQADLCNLSIPRIRRKEPRDLRGPRETGFSCSAVVSTDNSRVSFATWRHVANVEIGPDGRGTSTRRCGL